MSVEPGKWGVIYNPKAGTRKVQKRWKEIKEYMDSKGVNYDYVQSEGFGSVERLAKILANNGYRTIVIVGGDGALNDAINGIMLSDAEDKENIALGMIPNGIGNDFAKYWGLSTEYKPAVDCIINHRLKKIDVGFCNFYDGKEHQRRYFLNERGLRTKRNCQWSQNGVCRILTNELYTGKIINGKQEVTDFLTGQRADKDASEWMVVERPDLQIIDMETFEQAQQIMKSRGRAFKVDKQRQSNKYLFSTLIKCKECGWSFRRVVRTYKNTYVRWVCSGHNGKGADNCPNAVTVDEEELIEVLQEYFAGLLKTKKNVIRYVVGEFQRVYKAKDENLNYEKELNAQLAKLQKTRQKYMDMYADDLISREELNDRIGGMRKEIERLENELKMVSYHLTKGEQLESVLQQTFKEIEDIADVHQMTNAQLKRIIQKIEVDKDGNVDIYLRLFGDLGLDETVLIRNDET